MGSGTGEFEQQRDQQGHLKPKTAGQTGYQPSELKYTSPFVPLSNGGGDIIAKTTNGARTISEVNPPSEELQQQQKLYYPVWNARVFKGNVGGIPITMQLTTWRDDPTTFDGGYFYDAKGKRINVEGDFKRLGGTKFTVTIGAYYKDEEQDSSEVFNGVLDNSSPDNPIMTGTWTLGKAGKQLPFQLQSGSSQKAPQGQPAKPPSQEPKPPPAPKPPEKASSTLPPVPTTIPAAPTATTKPDQTKPQPSKPDPSKPPVPPSGPADWNKDFNGTISGKYAITIHLERYGNALKGYYLYPNSEAKIRIEFSSGAIDAKTKAVKLETTTGEVFNGAFVGDGNTFQGNWVGDGKAGPFVVAVAAPKPTKPPQQPAPGDDDSGSFDDRVGAEIRKVVDQFVFDVKVNWKEGGADKSKNLTIRTPYFINKNLRDDRMPENAAKERAAATGYSRALIDNAKAQKDSTLFNGKATPGEMQKFTQSLVNAMVKELPANQITSNSVIAWLKRYGIGVDCSGFVTQALDNVIENVAGTKTTIGEQRSGIPSWQLAGGYGNFAKVNTPASFRPGDTMWLDGHIRIITRVGPTANGKGTKFMTAESAIETYEGLKDDFGIQDAYRPGLMEVIWRYPNSSEIEGLQQKTNNNNWDEASVDRWTNDRRTHVYGRHKQLSEAQKREPKDPGGSPKKQEGDPPTGQADWKRDFTGKIGDKSNISMRLERYGDQLKGYYYYQSQGATNQIKFSRGSIDPKLKTVTLETGTGETFNGSFGENGKSFAGEWKGKGEPRQFSVRVNEKPAGKQNLSNEQLKDLVPLLPEGAGGYDLTNEQLKTLRDYQAQGKIIWIFETPGTTRAQDMTISEEGIVELKKYEGEGGKPYQDSSGYWTIGHGHLIDTNRNGKIDDHEWKAYDKLGFPRTLTLSQQDQLLRKDLPKYEKYVKDNINVPISQAMYDAFVFIAFNIPKALTSGMGLNQAINEQRYHDIPEEMYRWQYEGKTASKGLMNRRLKEITYFAKPYIKKKV